MNLDFKKYRILIKPILFMMGARMVDRRTSLMPMIISFPSVGFILTTVSLLVVLIIVHFYNKTNMNFTI